MFKMYFFSIACMLSITSFSLEINVPEILDKIDHLYRSHYSFSTVEMFIKNPNWERQLKLKVWSEEMENTLVEITYPNKEKGTKTLRKGTSVWNYLPNADQVVSIPPSMMMANWMGSDFTNDDLVKQTTLAGYYKGVLIKCENETADEICIDLKPKSKLISVWARIVLVVKTHDYFPVRQEFYNQAQKKVRVFEYSNKKLIQGRQIPTTLKAIMINSPGHETTLKYSDIDFIAKLNSNFFAESKLRNK